MAKTTVPSWISRAPHNLGTPSHGKLKADQWRTACTINLVITLIRLWSQHDGSPQERAFLDNYLSLVIAVRWSTMRSTSDDHIEIVQSHFHNYLTTFVFLYSKAHLIPSHHLSLHLPECIHSFGPVHGWWSFPFERYNGILQRKNSNSKMGKSSTRPSN